MNLARLEVLRNRVKLDRADFGPLLNEGGEYARWTPAEAYAAARWHAANDLGRLLDALLEEAAPCRCTWGLPDPECPSVIANGVTHDAVAAHLVGPAPAGVYAGIARGPSPYERSPSLAPVEGAQFARDLVDWPPRAPDPGSELVGMIPAASVVDVVKGRRWVWHDALAEHCAEVLASHWPTEIARSAVLDMFDGVSDLRLPYHETVGEPE